MLKKAFTLIEILIVVILLGILAAVVVPQFTDVAGDATIAANQTTARALMTQVELYEAREGTPPSTMADLETAGDVSNVSAEFEALTPAQLQAVVETGNLP